MRIIERSPRQLATKSQFLTKKKGGGDRVELIEIGHTTLNSFSKVT